MADESKLITCGRCGIYLFPGERSHLCNPRVQNLEKRVKHIEGFLNATGSFVPLEDSDG